jgi:YgiT-type zinc finger domain-containing protein
MPETRECPMCGGTMRIKETQSVIQVPGHTQASTRTTAEWVCPDCDYFEEVDEEAT